MSAVARKPQRGRTAPPAGPPSLARRLLRAVLGVLLLPAVFAVWFVLFPVRFIRSKRRIRADVIPVPSQADLFVERLGGLTEAGMTIGYLLQSCILQIDMLFYPQERTAPLHAPRSTPAASLRVKRRRHYHPGMVTSRRGIPIALTLTLVAPAVLLAFGFGAFQVYDSYVKEIVPPEELAINAPSRGARIYDRNGVLLYEFIDERDGMRLPVKLEDVSPLFIAATIATEDDTFFVNPGVNAKGLARAVWENLGPYVENAGEEEALDGSGGSSITQQLVKNVYIPQEERSKRSIDRKLREATYALELTDRYDKRQILEWYVNQISYGGLYNGVEAASQGYFGHSAKDLTLAEAALLAGIPQSPAAYDPLGRPEAAQARRDEILDLMAHKVTVQIGEEVWYTPTPEEIEEARATQVSVRKRDYPILAPHFVLNHVAPQLEVLLGRDALYRDGLVVTTSLDYDLQTRTQAILERWIREFEDISNSRNGAVLIVDNRTGELLTVIGSRDYFRSDIQGNVDNLTALNSPGSSFKPFVFLSSFIKLGWHPSTLIDDSPVSFRESDGTVFAPQNPTRGSYLGNITIARALGNSLNIPAFKAALRLGVPSILEVARWMGFTTLHGQYGPAIAIGGVDLSALDLTYGYSTLANNGLMRGAEAVAPHRPNERTIDPIIVLKVEDGAGKVRYDVNEHRAEYQVVPPTAAYEVTTILSDPANQCVTFGCGGVSVPGRVAAVKTGTSEPFDPKGPNAGKIGETWAFGYTPDYSVGVWAGNSNNAPIVNIYSTSISFRVMRDALQAAHNGRPSEAFAKPAGFQEYRAEAAPPSPTPQTDTRITATGLVPPPTTSTVASLTGATASAGAVNIQGIASAAYRVEIGSGPVPASWRTVASSGSGGNGTLGAVPTAGLAPGIYSIRVVVQDAAGATVSRPMTISVRP